MIKFIFRVFAFFSILLTQYAHATDITKINYLNNFNVADRIEDIGMLSKDKKWATFTTNRSFNGSLTSYENSYLRDIDGNKTHFLGDTNNYWKMTPVILADNQTIVFKSNKPLTGQDNNNALDFYIYNIERTTSDTKQTESIHLTLNLNADDSIIETEFSVNNYYSFNNSTELKLFDDAGQSYELVLYFQKVADDQWSVYSAINGNLILNDESAVLVQTLEFSESGTLIDHTPLILSASHLNTRIGSSDFTSSVTINWHNQDEAIFTSQLASDFKVNSLESNEVTLGSRTRVVNDLGEEFDKGIVDFWPIGESDEIYFTSAASNVISSTYSAVTNLYKYNLTTKKISLIIDNFEQRTIVNITNDGLTLLTKYSSQYFVYDVLSQVETTITLPLEFSQNIYNVVMDSSAQYLLYTLGGYQEKQFLLSHIATGEFSDISKALIDQYNIENIIGFNATASGIFASGNVNGSKVWYFDLSDFEALLVNVDSNYNALSSPTAKISPFNNVVNYSHYSCYSSSCGLYAFDLDSIDLPLPSSLSNGTASTNELAQITLSYDDVNADKYLISRYEEGLPENMTFIGEHTTGLYVDSNSNLDASKGYTYQVRACNKLYQCSDTLTIYDASLIAPNKVINLSTSGELSEDSKQDIRWDVVDGVSYRLTIYRGDRVEVVSSNNNFYTIPVYHNQIVRVQVQACISALCGESSSPLDLSKELINKPALRYYVLDGLDQITLKWPVIASANFYKVYGSRNNGEKHFRKKVFSTEFEENIYEFGDYLRYFVSACITEQECSQESEIYIRVSDELLQLSTPRLELRKQASGVLLKMTKYYGEGVGFDSLNIYRRKTRFAEPVLVKTLDTGFLSNYQVNYFDNIEVNQSYFYFVEGCINGKCKQSNESYFSGIDEYSQTMTHISDLAVSSGKYQDRVELTWTPPEQATSFLLYRGALGAEFSQLTRLEAKESTYQDFEIEQGYTYQYKLVPLIRELVGVDSNIVNALVLYNTGELWQPDTPTLTTVRDKSFGSIEFDWQSQANVDYYDIYSSSVESGTFRHLATRHNYNGNDSRIAYQMSSLAPGVEIYFKIKACSQYICSEMSESILTSTANSNIIPDTSSVPTLTLVNGNQIKIKLSPVEDATYYQVYRYNNLFSSQEKVFTTSELELIDNNLSEYSTYFYRTKACSAFDCALLSDYREIATMKGTSDGEVNGRDVYISSASKDLPNSILLSFAENYYHNGVSPISINIYQSLSLTAEKTLIEKRVSDLHQNLTFDAGVAGQQYYFWIENCYSTEDCLLDPYFQVGQMTTESLESIPAPEGFTASQGTELDNVKFSWLRNITGTQVKIFTEIAGEKTQVSPYSHLKSPDYQVEQQQFWAQRCYLDECSAFSESVLGWSAAKYINESLINAKDDDGQTSNGDLWTSAGSLNFIDGIAAYRASITSKQGIYTATGFSINSRLYFESYQSDCKDRVEFKWLNTSYSSYDSVYQSFVKIVQSDGTCDSPYLTELGYYLIFNNDYQSAVKVDLSNNVWFDLAIEVDNSSKITVTLPNEQIITAQLTSTEFNEFSYLNIHNDSMYNQNTYFSYLEVLSNGSFELERPTISDVYLSQSSGSSDVNIRWSSSELGDRTELILYKVHDWQENQSVNYSALSVLESYVISSELLEYDFTIPTISAHYVIGVRRCIADVCSPTSYKIFNPRGSYISRPQLKLSSSEVLNSIALEWQKIDDVDHYVLYKDDQNAGEILIGSTQDLTFEDTNLDYKQWRYWVKACMSDEQCSDNSNVVAGYPNIDSDNDGVFDLVELDLGTDPYDDDTDDDGLLDGEEITAGTDPFVIDSDGDGVIDGQDYYPVNQYQSVKSVILLDADRDGRSDILWRNSNNGDNWLWTMDGLTTIKSAAIDAVGSDWQLVGRGDFDGDGMSDIFWRHKTDGRNFIWLMDGFNVQQVAELSIISDVNWSVKAVADFNGDDKADIFWHHQGSGKTYVWLMDGVTKLNAKSGLQISDLSWQVAASGDVNGDGKSDIIWRHKNTGKNFIWQMDGTATNNRYLLNTVSTAWNLVGAGDLDGDGTDDLIWRNNSGLNWAYIMENGDIKTSAQINTISSTDWQVETIGDFDGDTKADIFWRHQKTGQTYIYLMDGYSIKTLGSANTVGYGWRAIE